MSASTGPAFGDSQPDPESLDSSLNTATLSLSRTVSEGSDSADSNTSSTKTKPTAVNVKGGHPTSYGSANKHRNAEEGGGKSTEWSDAELLEVRARERTCDGAYWRTSIGLLGGSLIVLRLFGMQFFPIGMVFMVLGIGFMGIGLVRRRELLSSDPYAENPTFRTNGVVVVLTALMCLVAYSVLIFLLAH